MFLQLKSGMQLGKWSGRSRDDQATKELSSLLIPLARHHLLQLHRLRLPSLKNRLLNIGRQQCQPQEAINKAAGHPFGFPNLAGRPEPTFLQQPLPPVRPRQCANLRLVRARLRRCPGVAAVGGDGHLSAAVSLAPCARATR